jgi:hypothetical protein
MDSAQHIVKLAGAVELVDRTMIELARANPAFRPTIETALIGQPEAILLVEFAGDDARCSCAAARAPGRADGRPGPARQRGRDARRSRRRRCGKCARPA